MLVKWNTSQWTRHDLRNSNNAKVKYVIKITLNLNLEKSGYSFTVRSLWLDERFLSRVKSVVRGLSLARTDLRTKCYDMQCVYNNRILPQTVEVLYGLDFLPDSSPFCTLCSSTHSDHAVHSLTELAPFFMNQRHRRESNPRNPRGRRGDSPPDLPAEAARCRQPVPAFLGQRERAPAWRSGVPGTGIRWPQWPAVQHAEEHGNSAVQPF